MVASLFVFQPHWAVDMFGFYIRKLKPLFYQETQKCKVSVNADETFLKTFCTATVIVVEGT